MGEGFDRVVVVGAERVPRLDTGGLELIGDLHPAAAAARRDQRDIGQLARARPALTRAHAFELPLGRRDAVAGKRQMVSSSFAE